MSASQKKGLDPSIPTPGTTVSHQHVSLEDRTTLLLAQLMEGGQEDEDTCSDLDLLTKLFNDDSEDATRSSEPHKPLYELVDTDSAETILGYLDMRQPAIVRGHATLTTSAYLKAAGDTGAEKLSEFFYSRVGRATYDDFILAFSVATAIFPAVPEIASGLFLSEGFLISLGPLMKRKWKSRKVEQAAMEMLNAACIQSACREAIKRYCTDWLEEIVNDIPQPVGDISSSERQQVAGDGSIQQRKHSEQARTLAAVVLAKLQVSLKLKMLSLLTKHI